MWLEICDTELSNTGIKTLSDISNHNILTLAMQIETIKELPLFIQKKTMTFL